MRICGVCVVFGFFVLLFVVAFIGAHFHDYHHSSLQHLMRCSRAAVEGSLSFSLSQTQAHTYKRTLDAFP